MVMMANFEIGRY